MTQIYGMQSPAGLNGVSTVIAEMDFETYSPAGFVWNNETQKWDAPRGANKKGLPIVGTAVYSEHPDAEVLCLAYDLKDRRGGRLWKPGDALPQDLFNHLAYGLLIEAWNAGFEWWIWTNICVKKYGFPPLPEDQLRCAAAKSRAHAYPGSLAPAGEVVNADIKKDKRGVQLISKFCIPRNPTKDNKALRTKVRGDIDEPDLYAYCLTDIKSEASISARIPDLTPGDMGELKVWQLDQRINRRGVQLDVESANAAIEILEQAQRKYNAELTQLTGGAVNAASELPSIKAWLATQGVVANSLTAESLEGLLAGELPPLARRVLQIREAIGSASVKKLYAMTNQATRAGRIHENFIYHQARTGRAAGAGVQMQNMPNSNGFMVRQCGPCKRYFGSMKIDCPHCGAPGFQSKLKEWNHEAVDFGLLAINTRSLEYVEYVFGDSLPIISNCLRGLLIAKPGHKLMCSDYSAIEAVVLAALAGEEWRLELFRTHGKIYEASGAQVMGIPLDEVLKHKETTGQHHPARKVGKVAELACGYQGGLGAWKKFGADEFLSDDEITNAFKAWRSANPQIVQLWWGLENAAKRAIMYPGVRYTHRELAYVCHNDALYCQLPSGRLLTYHRPRLEPGKFGDQITFEGWNTNQNNGPVGWIRMPTFGGRLTENVVQAVSRDILVTAIDNLEHEGYAVVLHVHDEIAAEVPEGFGNVERLEQIMSAMPPWASNWPIRATGGWQGKRYRK